MKEDIDLKEIGRKIHRSYHQDGLTEILFGSFILILGIEMVAETSANVYIGLMILTMLFGSFKMLIILPRIGYVRVSQERKTKERKRGWVLLIAFSLISILGLSIFLIASGETGLSLELVDHVKENIILILGVAMVCSMSVEAGLSGVRYKYVYAALILIAVVGGPLFNIPRHLRLILPSVVMILLGIVMLIRFLYKYRIPAKEVSNEKAIDATEIEGKDYLSFHQDGLLDILTGIFILGFGIDMLNASPGFLSSLCALPVVLLWLIRRYIIYPRHGCVSFSWTRSVSWERNFSWEQRKKGRTKLAVLIALWCIIMVILLTGWLEENATLSGQVYIAAFVSVGAILAGAKRLYVYAALTLLVFLTDYLLNIPTYLYFIPLGIAILISGVAVLKRFLHRYPKLMEA